MGYKDTKNITPFKKPIASVGKACG